MQAPGLIFIRKLPEKVPSTGVNKDNDLLTGQAMHVQVPLFPNKKELDESSRQLTENNKNLKVSYH